MAEPDELKTRILTTVDSYSSEMLDFIRDLVRVPTENPPGRQYQACVELLAGKLAEIGLEPEILEVPGAGLAAGEAVRRYCLSAAYGAGRRTLYFHGHYDVVPAADPAQFAPVLQDGCLFGRGSSDMKSGLAAMIYAVKALRDSGVDLQGRIGLLMVPDEETGGALGSGYLSQAGLLGQDGLGMLMPEPTSGVVWNASRGALSMRVIVKGKPAHVGLHYQGVNAFEQMLVAANALLELKAEIEFRQTGYRIEPEAARRSILMLGGQGCGGTNFNLVPSEYAFTIDRRINPEEDLAVEKERLFALFDQLRGQGLELEVEMLQEAPASGSPSDHPFARALTESVQAVTGQAPAFELCPGLLEIRFYAGRGIPAYAYGPGLLEVSHGPQEFVRLGDVANCTAIYALTAARLLT